MRKVITVEEAKKINKSLNGNYSSINLNYASGFKPSFSNLFFEELFRRYNDCYLMAYEKVIDFCYNEKIDFFEILKDTKLINNNLFGGSKYYSLILYAYEKRYITKEYCKSFVTRFTSHNSYTEDGLRNNIEFLDIFDEEQDIFEEYCFVFNEFFKYKQKHKREVHIKYEKLMKNSLDFFKDCDFYDKKRCENFYLSLIKEEVVPTIKQSMITTFCYQIEMDSDFDNLNKRMIASFGKIYSEVFNDLKNGKLILNYFSLMPNEYKLDLYISAEDNLLLNIKNAMQKFNEEIKDDLRTKVKDNLSYYAKKFNAILLNESLTKKENNINVPVKI